MVDGVAPKRGRPATSPCPWGADDMRALLAQLARVTEGVERLEIKVDALTPVTPEAFARAFYNLPIPQPVMPPIVARTTEAKPEPNEWARPA